MTNVLCCDIIVCVEKKVTHADLAHLVERDLAKVEVAGSSPVIRSIFFGITENGSLAQLGEHLPYKQRVTGSSPVASTTERSEVNRLLTVFNFLKSKEYQ